MQLISFARFWQLAGTNLHLPDQERVPSLIKLLSEYSVDQICGFQATLRKLIKEAETVELLLAGDLIYRGLCSDDTFLYLRAWLVFQGQETYRNVLVDVDQMAFLDSNFEYTEEYMYIPFKAYAKKTGKQDFYKICKSENYRHKSKSITQPAWVNSDKTINFQIVKNIFPDLYMKYGDAFKEWMES